jgi:hypothetical protein
MFVSVVDDGPLHVVCNDDGSVVGKVYSGRGQALAALRELHLKRAKAHDLELDGGNLWYVHDLNGYVVDGICPDEWVEQLCGCYEDGGTVEQHVA